MSDDINICEAFDRVAALGIALGAFPVTKFPDCWEHSIDERWFIAVNGHREPKKTSGGVVVNSFNCYVEYNGWPAGSFDPRGGVIAAGDCANEDTFIAALDEAIKRAAPAAEGERVVEELEKT